MAGCLIAVTAFAWAGYQEKAYGYSMVGWGILASVISLATLAGGVLTIRKSRHPAHRP